MRTWRAGASRLRAHPQVHVLVEAEMAVPDFGCARKLRTVVVGKRLESAALARHAGTGFMWRLRACVRAFGPWPLTLRRMALARAPPLRDGV